MSTDAKVEVASAGGGPEKSVAAVNNTTEETSKPTEPAQEPLIVPGYGSCGCMRPFLALPA